MSDKVRRRDKYNLIECLHLKSSHLRKAQYRSFEILYTKSFFVPGAPRQVFSVDEKTEEWT